MGPKRRPTLPVPRLWIAKEPDEDGAGERHDPGFEAGVSDSEAFYGAQDGDGGGDDAVAIEQGGADDAQERDAGDAPMMAGVHAEAGRHQGQESKNPALAIVVRAHHEEQVLDGNDQD